MTVLAPVGQAGDSRLAQPSVRVSVTVTNVMISTAVAGERQFRYLEPLSIQHICLPVAVSARQYWVRPFSSSNIYSSEAIAKQ